MEKTDRNCGGWGGYVKVARARGVIDVVEVWERVYDGKTDRCAAARARRSAAELARRLNCPLTDFITKVDAA